MKETHAPHPGRTESGSGILPLFPPPRKRLEAASTPSSPRAGLTLLELLVVLAIIAVIAGVALRSVSGTFDQARYAANIQQLEALEAALLAEAGFLHDIGRLPEAQGTDPENQLEELWRQGVLPSFQIVAAPGDPEVFLGVGWRGPYLRLGLGRSTLRDAFGRDYDLFAADGLPLAADTEPGILRSRSAEGEVGGDDYNSDLLLVLAADANAVALGLADSVIDRTTGDLLVRVHRETLNEPPQNADGNRVLVRVYGAIDGELRTLATQTLVVTGTILQHTFPELPFGPKVIRAYQTNDTNLPVDDNDPFGPTATPPTILPTRRSVPMPLLFERSSAALPLEVILRDF